MTMSELKRSQFIRLVVRHVLAISWDESFLRKAHWTSEWTPQTRVKVTGHLMTCADLLPDFVLIGATVDQFTGCVRLFCRIKS